MVPLEMSRSKWVRGVSRFNSNDGHFLIINNAQKALYNTVCFHRLTPAKHKSQAEVKTNTM
jgi:hypothetical protein